MNYAILLAGGSGERAKGIMPKQYIRAGGYMMVTHAMKPLFECDQIDAVYVVAEKDWRGEIRADAEDMGLKSDKQIGFAKPGTSRQSSILSGMLEIMEHKDINDDDTVLIHDAARPFLSVSLLYACYEALNGHDGVMPVLPMKDTVYLSEDGGSVSGLIDRSRLFAGQAPELFRLMPYYAANLALLPDGIHRINGASEPAIMAGMDIAMIPGDEKNFKVTSEADLERFIQEKEIKPE